MSARKVLKPLLQRRLLRELRGAQAEPIAECDCMPSRNDDGTENLLVWIGNVVGRAGTCWEGAQIKVLLQLPDEYPFKPPAVTVVTPVFHPNIGADGRVCAEFLAGGFSPALTLVKIMLLFCAMVHDPSTLVTDALDNEAWELYTSNRDAYEARCRELCRLHAAMSAADVAAAIKQVLSKNPASEVDSMPPRDKLPPPAS